MLKRACQQKYSLEQNRFISVINFTFTELSLISYIRRGDTPNFKKLGWGMGETRLGNAGFISYTRGHGINEEHWV